MGKVYFNDVNRNEPWNNLDYWSPAGSALVAVANISPYAQSVTVNFTLSIINNSCVLGACSGRVAWASASIQYGNSTPVTLLANNCTYQGNPYFNYSHTLTSEELQSVMNGENMITFTIKSCAPTVGSYNLEYNLTGYAEQTLSQSSETGTITVTVSTPGGYISGIPVSLTDTSTNTFVGNQPTDSSGKAVFDNLTIGDTYSATVNYAPFSEVTQSITLNDQNGSISIQLTCPSGTYYSTSITGQPQCTGNTVGTINAGLMEFLPAIVIVGGVIIGGILAWGWAISSPEREAGYSAERVVKGALGK